MKIVILLVSMFIFAGCSVVGKSNSESKIDFNRVSIVDDAGETEFSVLDIEGHGVGFRCLKSATGKCGFKISKNVCSAEKECKVIELAELRLGLADPLLEDYVWYESPEVLKYSYFKVN